MCSRRRLDPGWLEVDQLRSQVAFLQAKLSASAPRRKRNLLLDSVHTMKLDLNDKISALRRDLPHLIAEVLRDDGFGSAPVVAPPCSPRCRSPLASPPRLSPRLSNAVVPAKLPPLAQVPDFPIFFDVVAKTCNDDLPYPERKTLLIEPLLPGRVDPSWRDLALAQQNSIGLLCSSLPRRPAAEDLALFTKLHKIDLKLSGLQTLAASGSGRRRPDVLAAGEASAALAAHMSPSSRGKPSSSLVLAPSLLQQEAMAQKRDNPGAEAPSGQPCGS